MVKNKALPDSAEPPGLVWSLSLSPSQTWPYQGWSHMSSLLPTLVILRVPPGSCRGWTPAAQRSKKSGRFGATTHTFLQDNQKICLRHASIQSQKILRGQ